MQLETPARVIPQPIQQSHTTPASSSTLRVPTSERKAAQSSEEKVIVWPSSKVYKNGVGVAIISWRVHVCMIQK